MVECTNSHKPTMRDAWWVNLKNFPQGSSSLAITMVVMAGFQWILVCWWLLGPCPLNPSVIPLPISLDECLSPSPPPHHHYLHSNSPLKLLPSQSTSHPTQLHKLAFDPVHSSLFPRARCISCNPG